MQSAQAQPPLAQRVKTVSYSHAIALTDHPVVDEAFKSTDDFTDLFASWHLDSNQDVNGLLGLSILKNSLSITNEIGF